MKSLFSAIFLIATSLVYGQEQQPANAKAPSRTNTYMTVGVLRGGGSLVGVDIEQGITSRIGFQAGVGFRGYGFAATYHIKPNITSSYVSLNYIHQGLGEYHTLTLLGPAFNYRAPKGFTLQFGIANVLEVSRYMKETMASKGTQNYDPQVLPFYSIGWTFPL